MLFQVNQHALALGINVSDAFVYIQTSRLGDLCRNLCVRLYKCYIMIHSQRIVGTEVEFNDSELLAFVFFAHLLWPFVLRNFMSFELLSSQLLSSCII